MPLACLSARAQLACGVPLLAAYRPVSPFLLNWLARPVFFLTLTMLLVCSRDTLAAEPGSTLFLSGLASLTNPQKREASERIPWDQLTAEQTEKTRKVVRNASVYRKLPDQEVRSDVDLYQYLLDHPEIVVGMWQVMGVTKAKLTPTGPGKYQADDGSGTTCEIEVLHRDPQRLLLYTRGKYQGPLYPQPLRGDCVLLLTSRLQDPASQDNPEGLPGMPITVSMDAFVKLHQVALELVAKTLKPVFGRISDHNFAETIAFLGSVSQTAHTNPTGMLQLADKLPGVSQPVLQQYQGILLAISERAEQSDPLPTLATARSVQRMPPK